MEILTTTNTTLAQSLYTLFLVICSMPLLAQNELLEDASTCDEVYEWVLFGDDGKRQIAGESLLQTELTLAFYTQRNCWPAWYNKTNELSYIANFLQLLQTVQTPYTDYHLAKIEQLYNQWLTALPLTKAFDYQEVTPMDVLLTDAALHYSYQQANQHSQSGVIDETALVNHLEKTLQKGQLKNLFQHFPEKKINTTTSTGIADTPTPSNNGKRDEGLKEWVQKVAAKKQNTLLKEKIYMPLSLQKFYRHRNYAPIWFTDNQLNILGKALLKNLEESEYDGLNPAHYHVVTIKKWLQKIANDPKSITENGYRKLEILLTDGAIRCAWHLHYGSVNPKKMDFIWDVKRSTYANVTQRFIESAEYGRITAFFNEMRPKNATYKQLRKHCKFYTKLDKGKENTAPLKIEASLSKGQESEQVVRLNRLLRFFITNPNRNNDTYQQITKVTKDTLVTVKHALQTPLLDEVSTRKFLAGPQPLDVAYTYFTKVAEPRTVVDSFHNAQLFDEKLEKTVKQVQRSLGITADGVVGKGTAAKINDTYQWTLNRLKVNMERWRWIHNNFGKHYVYVNIPNYELEVVKNGQRKLKKRVVVGKVSQETPVFSKNMKYIEFNPSWKIPYSIAVEEMLPRIKKSAKYLKWRNMELYDKAGKLVDAEKVKWAEVDSTNFNYLIQQKPNKKNTLGTMKFMFPNRHHIYIHDTQSKGLFKKKKRAYSHGCIRLETPFELANYLLTSHPDWDAKDMKKLIAKGTVNKRITLTNSIPVYLLYFTAWTTSNGSLRFSSDIYGRDKVIQQALKRVK